MYMTKKNKILSIFFILGCICIVAIAVIASLVAKGTFTTSPVFCEGVAIDGVAVGGMKKADGRKKVQAHIEKTLSRQITINTSGNLLVVPAKDLGLVCRDSDDTIDAAYALGKTGGFFDKFYRLPEKDKKKGIFSLDYDVDETVLENYIKENCTIYDVKAKNSKLKFVNGKFKASQSHQGKEVQVKESVAVIAHELVKNLHEEDLEIETVVSITEPKYTQKQVEKCQDLLGSYSTYYGTSTMARANNVKTAANYIDGTVVYPGKKFSVIKTIKDRTEENGYQAAPEYSSGAVVEGIGGGVCQVSTTLYNAVINAELEIVERSPHSMVVSYVDVSRDAAISGTYKDFKFKNNTDVPIYIAAVADGATLSFRIYGEETRPENRTIKFKSEILQEIEPGKPIETVDKTKPASYKEVTQSAHIGYVAKLWKIVYIDGKKTDKILVNSSTYSAEPEHITVGAKKEATPSPKPTDDADKDAKATSSPSPTKKPAKKPKKTPVPTQKPVQTQQ